MSNACGAVVVLDGQTRRTRTNVRCSHDDVDGPRDIGTRMVMLCAARNQAALYRRTSPSSTAMPVRSGQLLLLNSVDPSMWRLETSEKHYTTNFEIGQPLDGSAYCCGDRRCGFGDRSRDGRPPSPRLGAAQLSMRHRWSVVDVDAAPAGAWLGILGQTRFTAYVGSYRIAQLRPGDVVFVSAAAGARSACGGTFQSSLERPVLGQAPGGSAERCVPSSTSSVTTTHSTTAPRRRTLVAVLFEMTSTCTSTTSAERSSSPHSRRCVSEDVFGAVRDDLPIRRVGSAVRILPA